MYEQDSRHGDGNVSDEWQGHGEHQPGGGAGVLLLPAQNTSGNWVKVVQRIPMRVHSTRVMRKTSVARRDER